MQRINEHFLKKLKFLDYILIIIFIVGIFLLYQFFNPEKKWIYIGLASNNIPYFQANSFRIDDIEKDSLGKEIGKILSVQIFDTPESLVSNKDVYSKIKLLVSVNPRSKEFEYKNKIVKVGALQEFRFGPTYIQGRIAELKEQDFPVTLETKTVTVKLYDQWPWLAENITESHGSIEKGIVELISKEVEPAKLTIITSQGEEVLGTNPQKINVTLKVKMKVRRVRNELILHQNERLIVGEVIPFNLGHTRIKDAYIVKIE